MGGMSLDIGLMVWTLLTFGGLFLLLARFAFKPLRRLLADREKAIRDSLARADQARESAERLVAANEQKMEEARGEVRRILEEGNRIVAQMKRESQDAAREEAARIVDQARSEIDRETQRALENLKETVASLSVRISRQVLKEQLDEKRHSQLTDEFIERLKQTHATRKL